MQTNPTTSGAGNGSNAQSANQKVASNGLSDMFTQLLIAQIKNQDPLSPSDPSQYVSQLATLSQTESLQQLSAMMSNNVSMMQSMQMLTLGAQVGSSVSVAVDHLALGEGPVPGTISFSNATTGATLVLTGADGAEHRIPLGAQKAGDLPFSFDAARLGLAPGDYALRVDTGDGASASVAVSGTIDSVKFSSDGAALNVSNIGTVLPSAIVSFNRQVASSN